MQPQSFYMKKRFLAGLTASQFLRAHWQKKPLLACNALAEYASAIDRDQLIELAGRDTMESRIVVCTRGRWLVRHGPFRRRDFDRLPRTGWTLLVQGVDTALESAARLLHAFSFIPYARLDDVMVSYAAPGGGVGPHYDSYDVFLVQALGRRRWRFGRQRDLTLVADAPLKLLARFSPQRDETLGPGDVLYLPPRWAHDGVAVDECITCSVGFRAPSSQELESRFLEFVQDRITLEGQYADPDLRPVRDPARLPPALVAKSARTLETLRWARDDVSEFLGRHLSEPKLQVLFERPSPALGASAFARTCAANGVRLALASRMLFDAHRIYLNGEAENLPDGGRALLKRLANARTLAGPVVVHHSVRRLLYEWYLAGYIQPGSGQP